MVQAAGSGQGDRFALVPAAHNQGGGPSHTYWIGKKEISNANFVTFLNDCLQNLDNERGQYMLFDTSTGDVYVNNGVVGQIAGNAQNLTTLLFSPTVNDQIVFVDDHYEVATSPFLFNEHPVAGVSWYGAVKYCNWMTLRMGFSAGQRAYTEATAADLNGWHPVTISTEAWAERDLNEDERAALLQLWGYRLPMDGGDQGDPSLFNEWYKAA
jgi:formylglycine-generating enzyme required for sulfatase activity